MQRLRNGTATIASARAGTGKSVINSHAGRPASILVLYVRVYIRGKDFHVLPGEHFHDFINNNRIYNERKNKKRWNIREVSL